MRRLALLVVAALVIAPAVADWGDPIKWNQMDAIDTYGGASWIDNDTPSDALTADDFQCTVTGEINDIHWAGWSYYGSQYIAGFRFQIFSDVPATPTEESHPGTLLWEYNEMTPYNGFFGWKDNGDGTFQVNLPEPYWFHQDYGTIYWLSIQGVMVDDGYFDAYYWNFRQRGLNWGDDAAFTSTYFGNPPYSHWGVDPNDAVNLYEGTLPANWLYSLDMAFALSGTPEPTTLLLLGLGVGLFVRRR